jgi:predicted TIM-barrel fold metal-dependent hydrolase
MARQPHRIDVHHHIIPDEYATALDEAGYSMVAGVERPAWSAALSFEVMDEHGIEVAIGSISAPGVHFGDDSKATALARLCNEAAADLAAKHPGRFGGFALLPLPDVDGALREVEHALDVLELDGVVLLASQNDGRYLGDPVFDELLAELDRRQAVAFIHPAIPTSQQHIPVDIPVFAMEFTFDTTRAAFNLAYTGALERHPNIRFILSHAGGTVPYLAWRFNLLWFRDPELMKRAPKGGMHYLTQLYYDTALSANPHALRSLTELVGPDRILFGSDYPFAPEPLTGVTVEGVRSFDGFDDAARECIERGNALDLFPRVAKRMGSRST